MDDLSGLLNCSNIGCSLSGITMNYLLYANDTCLLAPSPEALQRLLNISSEFACANDAISNEDKTKLSSRFFSTFIKNYLHNS
jgi:hypothetical protein